MRPCFTLFLLIACLSFQFIHAQEEWSRFVPPGWEKLVYKTADLDGEGGEDAILLLKKRDEDSMMADSTPRPLLILLRDQAGTLRESLRAETAVMCRTCGGVWGDPFSELDVFPRGFTLHFYGGSNWRWAKSFRFVYEPKLENWILAEEKQLSFHTSDIEGTQKEIAISGEELGYTPLDEFNVYGDAKEETWKVTAPKVYFYNEPDRAGTPRKSYLLQGDTLIVHRVLENFVEGRFEGKSVITGFLLKKNLARIH
jgi:hypothetical protein